MRRLRAQLAHLGEISGRRDSDSGFALDGLDQKGDRVRRDGVGQRLVVAERDDAEPFGERAEAVARVGIGGEAHDGDGAAVKIVGADDDLGLVLRHAAHFIAPLANRLDGGFDGLGAGVHGQDLVGAGEAREFFVEQPELVVAEGARGDRQLAGLLDQGRQDLRMAMALVDGGVGRKAVEVAVAVDVPNPNAAPAAQHHVERLVVMGPKAPFAVIQVD